jgi:hypothetical protein
MRMICSKCGHESNGIQVSPDYEPGQHCKFVRSAIRFSYSYGGQEVDEFLLSPSFVALHGISETSLPLPESYPGWVAQLRIECDHCFNREAGR